MKILAIVLNLLFPGVGTIVIGKYGQGIVQLILVGIGILFCFTIIGVVIGYPLIFAAWLWALITAATFQDKPLTIVVQNSTTPPG